MAETWLLNETITSALAEQTVNFVSSGSEFVGIKSIAVTSGFELKYYVQQGSSTTDLPAYDTTNGWLDTTYRAITFAIPPTGDLLTWLQANGNKQVARKSYDLSTSAKWATLTAGNHNVQIVAKASGYRDSEKSAAVTVNKTIISAGTYKFNDTIVAPASGSATAFIHFKVNDTSYNSISVTSLVSVMYTETLGEGITVYNNTDKWAAVDTANQIITITADKEVPYKFYEWFTANASAYTPTYTIEAGTYKFIDNPNVSGITGEFNLNFTSNNSTFTSIKFPGDTTYCLMAYLPLSGLSELGYWDYGSNWGYLNTISGNFSPVDEAQTISIETEQQVSAEFYKWAITDGNLVKQVEPTGETWLLNNVLDSSSLTFFDINFVSNNVSYTGIARDYNPGEDFDDLIYSAGPTSSDNYTAYSNGTWENQADRTLTFAIPPTGDLLNWLQANGFKLKNTLTYNSIQDMINQLNNAPSSLLEYADVLEITNSSTKFYVAAIDSGWNPYSYTSDEATIQDISNNGYIKVGYYRVSILP